MKRVTATLLTLMTLSSLVLPADASDTGLIYIAPLAKGGGTITASQRNDTVHRLIDEDEATSWGASSGEASWIIRDFGQPVEVIAVEWYLRPSENNNETATYSWDYSPDGQTWEVLQPTTTVFRTTTNPVRERLTLDTPVVAQKIWLNIDLSYNWTGVNDIYPATVPEPPSNLTVKPKSAFVVMLTWYGSPSLGVQKYYVYRDGTLIGESPGGAFVDRTADPNTVYTYVVEAVANTGLSSPRVAAEPVSTPSNSVTQLRPELPGTPLEFPRSFTFQRQVGEGAEVKLRVDGKGFPVQIDGLNQIMGLAGAVLAGHEIEAMYEEGTIIGWTTASWDGSFTITTNESIDAQAILPIRSR